MTDGVDSSGPRRETNVEMAHALLADLQTLTRCAGPLMAICELVDGAQRERATSASRCHPPEA